MPLPPELAQMIGKPPGAGDAPAIPGSPQSAPISSPMSTNEPKEGDKLAAENQVNIAMTMLEQALMAFGSSTDEGKSVLDVLKKLSNTFSKQKTEELVPAQLMSMMQGMPQVGGGAAMAGGQPPQGAQPPQGVPPQQPPMM